MANSSIYNLLFEKSITQMAGSKSTNLIQLMNSKKEFLILVFSNLLVQLGITYYVSQKTNNPDLNIWILVIIQFAILLLLILVPMNSYLKFLVFCAFSYLTGLLFTFLKNKYDKNLVNSVIVSTMALFAFMCATGVTLLLGGIKLGVRFGALLFWCLLALIIFRIILLFNQTATTLSKLASFFGMMLFSVYIVYDTNTILQRNYYGDFITASLDYYLDILNLFLNILRSNNE